MPQVPCQQTMDDQRSTAECESIPSAETSSSSREIDVPNITVPAFVFSFGYGEGALMDPSEQRSAFEDSPSYDANAVSVFNAGTGSDAFQYGCHGDIEESQDQHEAASLCKISSGDELPVQGHLNSQSAPSTALSSEQLSTSSSSLRFTNDDLMDHSEQSTLFGHSDGDSTNRLVHQEMFNKSLDLSHQQHCVFSKCSGDLGYVKQLKPSETCGETLDRDQQPAILCDMGLRGRSIGDQEGLSRETLHSDELRGSALNELEPHDELKNRMNWDEQEQPSTEHSSTDSPLGQSTRQPIVEMHPDSNENLESRALADAEPWRIGTIPVSPSYSPSGRMSPESQLETQDAEELPNSEDREPFVTASTLSASQPTPEDRTAFDDSSNDQARIESSLRVALGGTDEPTTSREASLCAPCADSAFTMHPGNDISGGQAHQQKCVREGCTNPAVQSNEWDGEYCSSECVVLHCNKVFSAWVSRRLGNRGALQHTILPAERPCLQH